MFIKHLKGYSGLFICSFFEHMCIHAYIHICTLFVLTFYVGNRVISTVRLLYLESGVDDGK